MWYALGMTAPIFVRQPTTDELAALQAAVRGNDAFAVRRAQIILASAARQTASQIAPTWHCTSEAVREVIHAYNHCGLVCLHKGSNRALSQKPELDESKADALQAILHQSPREFGLPHSLWSLARLAIVCQQQGMTREVVSIETVRQALLRLGLKWRKARRHISSPDPAYAAKKKGVTS